MTQLAERLIKLQRKHGFAIMNKPYHTIYQGENLKVWFVFKDLEEGTYCVGWISPDDHSPMPEFEAATPEECNQWISDNVNWTEQETC